MTKKDTLFKQPIESVSPFSFNQDVADVFDDMIERSIPFYHDIQVMMGRITSSFLSDGDTVYDLGCSTGQLISHFCHTLPQKNSRYVGVDNSPAMIETASGQLKPLLKSHHITLKCQDLNQPLTIPHAKVVCLVLTYQFLDPDSRLLLLHSIFNQLAPGGALLMVEKIAHEDDTCHHLFTDLYHCYKKDRGYTDIEIAQKKDALEDVLIPDTLSCHLARLKTLGFSPVTPFFQWFNFCGLLAIKPT